MAALPTGVIAPADHRPWPVITDADRRAVARVLDRGVLSGPFAPEATALQDVFAAYVGADHALMTHSGTSALVLALAAAGLGEGDEVLVPAYSFIATAMAVLQVGALPVFVDVDPVTGLMDPEDAARWVGPATRALMPVHVHGCPADLEALGALADAHDLRLVEDAAQAHGATYGGRPVGALRDGGGFSLQSSKNLGVGEGGLFVTRSEAAFELADSVRNFGQDLGPRDRAQYDPARPLDGNRALNVVRMGSMMRGNEMAAALALSQLERLPDLTARCQAHAARLSARLAALPGVVPPVVPAGRTSVHHKFRVRLDAVDAGFAPADRPRLLAGGSTALRAAGVQVTAWEKGPQTAFDLFRTRRGFGRGWPWTLGDPARLAENYRPERFPGAADHVGGSFLLFSQSFPLIAQETALVDRYADVFEAVWDARETLLGA